MWEVRVHSPTPHPIKETQRAPHTTTSPPHIRLLMSRQLSDQHSEGADLLLSSSNKTLLNKAPEILKLHLLKGLPVST